MSIEELYRSRIDDDRFNTSYPLCPQDWARFRVDGELSFDDVGELCLYIHIPFCQHLCKFCEYTRMKCPSEQVQTNYIRTIGREMEIFVKSHSNATLFGFDIGGGTPTTLCDDAFRKLLDVYSLVTNSISLSKDFEPSIEATFSTITLSKAVTIVENGIRRISLGVQSSSENILYENGREITGHTKMKTVLDMLRDCGISKVNLDFMYGLQRQTMESLHKDLALIQELNPEQVTLYELRTNMIGQHPHVSHDMRFEMYSMLYNALTSMGYHARFGQNTFSKDVTDMGVSSYLRHRMTECMPYKGFGISAQSMTHQGVSYNIGKNSHKLASIISSDNFPAQHTYLLPPIEIAAKYVAIAAYSGAFSWSKYKQLLGSSYNTHHEEILQYTVEHGLLYKSGDIVAITKDGFKHYGAVFSLFYP